MSGFEGFEGLFEGNEDDEFKVDHFRVMELDMKLMQCLSPNSFDQEDVERVVETQDQNEINKTRKKLTEKIKDAMKGFTADEIAWLMQMYVAQSLIEEVRVSFTRERMSFALMKVFKGGLGRDE